MADDRPYRYNRTQYNQVFGRRLHQCINDVRGDEKLKAKEKIVAEYLPQLASRVFDVQPPDGGDFRVNEAHYAAEGAENNNQDTQHTDAKSGAMEVFHEIVHSQNMDRPADFVG